MRYQIVFCAAGVLAAMPAGGPLTAQTAAPWQTAARLHRTLEKSVPGTLLIDNAGVEFRSAGSMERWPWIEIRSFDLSPRELTLIGYQNRPWREPGERRFRFTLVSPVPPGIAARLAARVERPARNGVPEMSVAAMAEIPAHRRALSGGSNGVIRFRNDGIDYVTPDGRGSRSWRWEDIETIANPDPWELRIAGYREIAEFDLKQPMPSQLFERVWDRLYGGRP